jgi:hypothetical protein
MFLRLGSILRFIVAAFALPVVSCLSAFGQSGSFVLPRTSTESSELVSIAPTPTSSEHRFWDRKNQALFVALSALNAADFVVTRANLRTGGKEMNPIARVFGNSTPGLAVDFAGETASVIGLGYLFHKTGHHKLERIVSIVNIGASGAAVSYGFSHR